MKKRKSGFSNLFFALIGVPFFVGGCASGYLAFRPIFDHVRALGWVEVPATIESVELKRHSGGEGGPTYEVACTYVYSFGGQNNTGLAERLPLDERSYRGNRIGLHSGADNIGQWQQRTYARLKAAHDAGRTVPCYVNPANPSEALLDRDIRFGLMVLMLIFPATFCPIGAGLSLAAMRAWLDNRRKRRREAFIPMDEPWLVREDWASGVLRPSQTGARFLAVLAVYWNLVWLPALIFLPGEVMKGNLLSLLGLIGPGIGAVLATVAVRSAIQRKKFGASRFEMDKPPGAVGGQLAGELVLVGEVAGLDRIEAILQCRNTVISRSGGESKSQTKTIWEAKQELAAPPVRFGREEIRLPLAFKIPPTCRPTDDSNEKDSVAWRLLVRGETVGVDLALEFDVPVYRIQETSPRAADELR